MSVHLEPAEPPICVLDAHVDHRVLRAVVPEDYALSCKPGNDSRNRGLEVTGRALLAATPEVLNSLVIDRVIGSEAPWGTWRHGLALMGWMPTKRILDDVAIEPASPPQLDRLVVGLAVGPSCGSRHSTRWDMRLRSTPAPH